LVDPTELLYSPNAANLIFRDTSTQTFATDINGQAVYAGELADGTHVFACSALITGATGGQNRRVGWGTADERLCHVVDNDFDAQTNDFFSTEEFRVLVDTNQ
ncbi:MAG: hypothetical protein KC422_25995, partial [Trueperaceae bacterium]|nr:hypothetical protein [Trueperaceae bacterium]